jgi:hypothetical protein
MTRFIVSTDELTNEQAKAFIAYLREHNCGWWHYLPNTWLIDADDGAITVDVLVDKLVDEIAPKKYCLVHRLGDEFDWKGYGPATKDRNMFNWLDKNWSTRSGE